jgi:hypothetical protein
MTLDAVTRRRVGTIVVRETHGAVLGLVVTAHKNKQAKDGK